MSFRDRSSGSTRGRSRGSSGSQGRTKFNRSGRDADTGRPSNSTRSRKPRSGDLIGKYKPPSGSNRNENVMWDRDRTPDRDRGGGRDGRDGHDNNWPRPNPNPPGHGGNDRDNDWWRRYGKKQYPDHRPPGPYRFDQGIGRDFHLGRYDFGRRTKHDWEWSGYRDKYYSNARKYYRKLDKYRQRQYDIYRRQWRYFVPFLGQMPMAGAATDCHWNIVNAARQGMAQIMMRWGINSSEISYISQYYGQQAADQYIAQRLGPQFQMYQQEVMQLQQQISMMAQQCSMGAGGGYGGGGFF